MRVRILAAALILLVPAVLAGGCHLWAQQHYRAAQESLARWDFDAAQHHLTRCAHDWLLRPRSLLLLARTARMAGRHDEAEALLRTCRERGVAAEAVDLEYKLLRAQQGELPAVEGFLVDRLLQDHADSVIILEVLAPTYLKHFRLYEAQACVRKWVEWEPDRVQAWVVAAQVYERSRATEDTVASYRRVVELDPENLPARLTLAGLLTEGHDPEAALAHFQYVRDRQGDTPAVLGGLARCYRALNRSAEARCFLEQLLAAQPRHGQALAERARLALETESVEEAEIWFRRAADVLPFEKDILYGFYQVLVRRGRATEAEEVLAKLRRVEEDVARLQEVTAAIAGQPHDPDLRCEAGTILLRNGQESEGLRWLESALQEDPSHAATHRALADHHEHVGEADKANLHRQAAAQRRE